MTFNVEAQTMEKCGQFEFTMEGLYIDRRVQIRSEQQLARQSTIAAETEKTATSGERVGQGAGCLQQHNKTNIRAEPCHVAIVWRHPPL
jgi:hypothetical protein